MARHNRINMTPTKMIVGYTESCVYLEYKNVINITAGFVFNTIFYVRLSPTKKINNSTYKDALN